MTAPLAQTSTAEHDGYKLLLIGDSGVGKTGLFARFCKQTFYESTISTLGIDYRERRIIIEGKKIKLKIWDTAGQERFRSITTSYYRNADGIFLVYDITNIKSFENVQMWIASICKYASPAGVEVILVGNKCDKEDSRAISIKQGEKLALAHGVAFIETSAKTDTNIETALVMLATKIKTKLATVPSPAEEVTIGLQRPFVLKDVPTPDPARTSCPGCVAF